MSKSVDILFVGDTSTSLDEERTSVANGIGSFVSQLPSDVDYQIGVLIGHGSNSPYTGKLSRKPNSSNPYVLSSKLHSSSQIQTYLRENLTNYPSDPGDPTNPYNPGAAGADGGEEMLYSAFRAVEPNSSKLQAIKDQGFFRSDAALAVIFVTDENDICSPYTGSRPKDPIDTDQSEKWAFQRDCNGVTHSTVYQRLKALQGNNPLVVAGIYYSDLNTVPSGNENGFGYGIDDIVKLGNGLSVDLAKGQYAQGLADIGKLTTTKLNLQTEFGLSHSSVDLASIQVKVDSVMKSYVYQPNSNEVQLAPADAGHALSKVEVKYCVKPSN